MAPSKLSGHQIILWTEFQLLRLMLVVARKTYYQGQHCLPVPPELHSAQACTEQPVTMAPRTRYRRILWCRQRHRACSPPPAAARPELRQTSAIPRPCGSPRRRGPSRWWESPLMKFVTFLQECICEDGDWIKQMKRRSRIKHVWNEHLSLNWISIWAFGLMIAEWKFDGRNV